MSHLQKQYYNLFDRNPTPMGIVDINTLQFLAVNKASTLNYGYSFKEFLSLTLTDLQLQDEAGVLQSERHNQGGDNEKVKKMRHRKKNGEIILTEVSLSEIIFKNKKCSLLLLKDITEIVKAREEKKLAEEEKIKQQNFTAYILENFPVDVAIFDKNHRYILLNKTAVRNDDMRKWMIGKDDFEYFALKGTDMSIARKRRELFTKAIAGQSEEWIDEHIVDGKLKYVLRKFYPYYEDGQLKHVYGYGMDITALKKAQMQRDEYVKQLEKIAFTTSHKIRQPLCNLQGLIPLLEMEKSESGELKNIINCMQNSINNMDEFTRDLAAKLHEYKQNLYLTETI